MLFTARLSVQAAVLLTIVACASATPTASVSPTASQQPTATAIASGTAAATGSPNVSPSPTVGPSATATVAPTASLAPTVPPTASPSPSPAVAGVELVAGGGTATPGNGLLASSVHLIRPTGVAVAPDGSVWVIDSSNLLLHIGLDGTISDLTGGFTNPEGVAVGPDGSVYVADRGAYRIASPNGNGGTVTFAGIEFLAGFNGDGRLAKRTRLWLPYEVATDGAGNVYIADTGNARIRVVDIATLKVQTIAGTGTSGFSGDGGPAIDAQISDSRAIAIDPAATALLIADYQNSRVRRVDMTTGLMSTVAGTGTGVVPYSPALTGLQTPLTHLLAVAVDGMGNAYLPVFYSDLGVVIMRLDSTGAMTRIAGGGLLAQAGVAPFDLKLGDVYGLAVDQTNGDIYICTSDGRVYRVPAAASIGP